MKHWSFMNTSMSIYVYMQNGWRSLMKASFKGHDKVVEILLAAGAKTDVWAMVSFQHCIRVPFNCVC